MNFLSFQNRLCIFGKTINNVDARNISVHERNPDNNPVENDQDLSLLKM